MVVEKGHSLTSAITAFPILSFPISSGFLVALCTFSCSQIVDFYTAICGSGKEMRSEKYSGQEEPINYINLSISISISTFQNLDKLTIDGTRTDTVYSSGGSRGGSMGSMEPLF